MESLLTCPLCSQPGFSDVDSLRLALISATSRRLVCPVCQDILLGLDKLTIHLVSHSLHDHLVRACFASSFSASPLAISHNSAQDSPVETAQAPPSTQNQINIPLILNSSSMHGCVTQMDVPQSSPVVENKISSNSPSYILINFPTADALQAQGTSHSVLSSTDQSEKNVISTNLPVTTDKSDECIDHSLYRSNCVTNETELMFKLHNTSTSQRVFNSPEASGKARCTNEAVLGAPLNAVIQEETSTSQHPIHSREGSTSHIIVENIMVMNEDVQDGNTVSGREPSVSKTTLVSTSQSEDIQMSDEFLSQKEISNSSEGSTCNICGINFRDSHIASLHHQLVHDRVEENKSVEPLAPHSMKKAQCWSSRQKKVPLSRPEREGASSPHRFPCHLCSKVFRMRGSLMVHLRVAHTSSSMIGLAARIAEGSTTSDAKTETEPVSNSSNEPAVPFINPQASQHSSHESITNHKTCTVQPTSHNPLAYDGSLAFCSTSRQHSPPFLPLCNSAHTSTGNFPGIDISSTFLEQNNHVIKLQKNPLGSDTFSTHPAHPSSPHNSAVPSPLMSPSSPVTSTNASSTESPNAVAGMYFTCTVCIKTFNKESALAQHLKSHEGKQWECDVCAKLFTTKYFLKKHKRLHTGEMPYTCGICNKSFTFQQSYHKHLLYHSDEKPHTCSDCGRAFKELSTLHNHQRIHTGEKPWACESCGKCFRQRVSYLVHRRIHTGAMPYHCNACGKSFRYKVSQRTHKCAAQTPLISESTDVLQGLPSSSEIQRETANTISSPEHLDQVSVCRNQERLCQEQESHLRLKDQLKQLNIKQEQLHSKSDCQFTDQHVQQQHQHQRLQQFVEQAQQFLQHQSKEDTPSSSVYSEQSKFQQKKEYNKTLAACSQANAKHFDLLNDNSKNLLCEEDSHGQTQEQWHVQNRQQDQPCQQLESIQLQKDPYCVVSNKSSESVASKKDPKPDESMFSVPCEESFSESVKILQESAPKSPPIADASSDLLQDILSMVMSPGMDSASSPSEQMQQLSLSGNVCTEDNDTNKIIWDAEPGTELRRLLYGSFEDDSHI